MRKYIKIKIQVNAKIHIKQAKIYRTHAASNIFLPVVIKILAVKVTRFVKKNTTQTQVQINFPTILFRFLHKSDQK